MSSPYVGEIRLFAGNFAPLDWAFCDGSLISISENEVLFALIGTTYGGDGVSTYALPDLRGRSPVHQGQGPGLSPYVIGQAGGTETVTLTSAQVPPHHHQLFAVDSAATNANGAGLLPAKLAPTAGSTASGYIAANGATVTMAPGTLAASGGNQPHDNLSPYLAATYIISLYGIFPSQN